MLIDKIDEKLFEPLKKEEISTAIVRPPLSYWQDAWIRLKKNKLAITGLIIIIFIILFSFIGPFLTKFSYYETSLYNAYKSPTLEHPLGTDELGRDVLVRVMYGGRISLAVGFVASFVNLLIGVIYGGISGYIGGRVDDVMMRIVDILFSIPVLLIVILLMVVLGPGLVNIFIALGISYWTGMARIVRGQILSLKEQEFTLAARMLGATKSQILFRHLIPNTIGPIIVTATFQIPNAIFFESFLSFIGLGVSAPMASWGVLASDSIRAIRAYPYLIFFPALFICITMLSFNFLGDGLRDALDPRLRR